MVKPVFNREREIREIETEREQPSREQPSFKTRQDDSHLNMVTREEAERIERMSQQAATRAVEMAIEKVRKEREDNEDTGSVISSKTVQELKNIAGVFNALKEFSANPLQKAIEGKVGDVAAGVVERAFTPHPEPQKKDLVDLFLNSQFAYGLGSGMGQRSPELVESMGRTFGQEKAGQMIEGVLGQSRVQGQIQGIGNPGGIGAETKDPRQENIDALISLDENNAEHVAAYARSQGDIPIDVARKMLMIHKDAKIRQMQNNPGRDSGTGLDGISNEERRRNEEFVRGMEEKNIQSPIPENVVEYKRPIASPAQAMEVPVITNSTVLSTEGPIVDSKWTDDVQQQDTQQNVPQNVSQNVIGQDQMALLTDVLQKMSVEISKLRSDIDEIKKFNKDVGKEEIKDVGKEEIKVQDIRYDINNQEIKQEKVSSTIHHIKDIRKGKTKEE